MTNVLTKKELTLLQSLQIEKGFREDTIAQLKKDQADTIKSLFLFAEQIESELKARGEEVKTEGGAVSAIEVVDTLLGSLLELVREREEDLFSRLEHRDKDNFLDCMVEVQNCFLEKQKSDLLDSVKYRLMRDAYYLISTSGCRTMENMELAVSNA